MRPEHWLFTIPLRLRSLFHWAQADQELDDELRDHLARKTEEYVAQGMTREEAHRRARLDLGGIEQTKEKCRDARRVNLIQDFVQDLQFGLRVLRKSPGFTAVAVLTLALGIGANTAIFSLVDCLVLRPLPLSHPKQMVFLASTGKDGGTGTTFSYPDYLEIRKETRDVFSDVSALQMYQMDGLSVDGKSQPMWAFYVASNFFDLIDIKPALGRFMLPSEGQVAGAGPVLVLSYSYWKSRFNADPGIVGKKASVNGQPVTIIGVAPESFHGLNALLDTQGYLPVGMAAVLGDASNDFLTAREPRFTLVARLKPDANLQQADSAMQVVSQRLTLQNAKADAWLTLRAIQLGPVSMSLGPAGPRILALASALFLILAASILVLACMNIASLCLVRAAARQREVTMRAALGATRGRLIRQLLTESLLLAALGCAAGIILGVGGSRSFSSISFHTALPIVLDFRFDWRVFLYALAAAALTTLLVGPVPALRTARGDVNKVLHEGGRTFSVSGHRLRGALVSAQVGGSLMLLIVAGLFTRSLENIQHSDLGFDPTHVLNLSIDPHEAGYDETHARSFFQTLLDRAHAIPGVQSASLAAAVPMGYYDYAAGLKVDGYEAPPNEGIPFAGYNAVTPDYFQTMRIPLLSGRDFRNSDTRDSQFVAIVNQSMADGFWRGQDPIGRRFSTTHDPSHSVEIIGVVKNSRGASSGLDDLTEIHPFFYVPLAQHIHPIATLQARTAAAPEALAREMISLIHSLEPAMPVFDVQTMTDALDTWNGFLLFRFVAALAGALGTLGLLLAVVGVYGVISYAASQRTHEIGIRMALGAQPFQTLKMIFAQALAIVGVGVIAGVLAAAAMARLVGNLLIGVPPLDPLTYSAASLLLAAVALAASYLPARRAMRVDPMVALRHE